MKDAFFQEYTNIKISKYKREYVNIKINFKKINYSDNRRDVSKFWRKETI